MADNENKPPDKPADGADIHFIGMATGSVDAGIADLVAKAKTGNLHHFLIFTEDRNRDFQYRVWGEEVSVDRLLRYAEELRYWAARVIAYANVQKKG